ncbi:soluble NSF attachment protein [Gongronella butleri]|nr:soluble NSF attachment protein [Gongronella butleri]
MEAERIREGVKLMQSGDKATTKGLFRKPDWDLAAGYYDQAATCFKVARSFDQAVQAYTKASEALFKSNAMHMAGKAMENAALILVNNLNQPQRGAEAYKQASNLFMTDGKMIRAAEQLGKAAKAMEPIDVNAAIDLYSSSIDLYEQEERGSFSTETYKKAIGLSVKSRKYAKAVELLHRQAPTLQKMTSRSPANKANLSMLVLLFAMDDEVEAGKQFNNMCGNEEAGLAQQMLRAYDESDQELLEKTVRDQHFSFLDNEIVRLARSLTVPGESLSSQKQPQQQYQARAPLPPAGYAEKQGLYNNTRAPAGGPPPPPPGYDGPAAFMPEKSQPYPSEMPYNQAPPPPPAFQQQPPPQNAHQPYPTQSGSRPPHNYADDDDDDDLL